METQDNNRLAAVEAILMETAQQIKDSRTVFEQQIKDSRTAFEQEMKDSRTAFEQEMKQRQATSDVEMQKIRDAFAEQIKQSHATFEQEMRQSREEFDRKSDALNVQIKEVNQHIGGVSKSHGLFAEEYFFNSFDKGKQTFFGETFDAIRKNMTGPETDDEYDIVMLNGHAVGIVEVKFKARDNDISKVLKKVNSFRINFPKYNNHRIYLGYATLAFDKNTEQECVDQGIAIIKQVGDTVVINDEHLKVF